MAKNKTKQEYMDLLNEMITYYSDEDNRWMFDYKRYAIERGFSWDKLRQMRVKHKDLNELILILMEIIMDTVERSIITKRVHDGFSLRMLKLWSVHTKEYYTQDELIALDIKKAERDRIKAETQNINANTKTIRIGFKDED